MCNLYCGQEATVRSEYGETMVSYKGVRQGYIFISLMFNLYAEQII